MGSAKKQLQAFDKLFPELIEEWPNHLSLYHLKLKVFNTQSHDKKENLMKINDAIVEVLNLINITELQAHFFIKDGTDTTEEFKKLRKEKSKERDILVDTLLIKLNVMKDFYILASTDEKEIS